MTLTGAETEETLYSHLSESFRQLGPVLNGPAIRYEGRYFDRAAGVMRQQVWRIGETLSAGWLASRVPADVLMEGDELLVVTSMPTQARGTTPSVSLAPDGRGFLVRDACGDGRWIELPEKVAGEPRCTIGPTGTLVIRGLRKAVGAIPATRGRRQVRRATWPLPPAILRVADPQGSELAT